jgi:hypothetical protein
MFDCGSLRGPRGLPLTLYGLPVLVPTVMVPVPAL